MVPKSRRSFEAFRKVLADNSAVLLEDGWLGATTPHRLRCALGHEVTANPDYVRIGGGVCRACSGKDPATAKAAFRARVAALGGEVLEPRWLGVGKPHRVKCAAGHECFPRPSGLRSGKGLCSICAGNSTVAAEMLFRERLASLGAILLEPVWLGNHVPHRVQCPAGHLCSPRPHNLSRGTGICITCAGQDPAVAARTFREALERLGAVLLEPQWLGRHAPHRVRCAAGHVCHPRPGDVSRGQGICFTCTGKSPEMAWAAFRAQIASLGAILHERAWLGSQVGHRVTCAAGHECFPRPAQIAQGTGICAACAGKQWDVFYVVTSPRSHHVKFGITSGNPRPRLRDHRREGYETTELLLTGLPFAVAPVIERAVKSALRDAGEVPVRGLEYYDISTLALILDVATGYGHGEVAA